MIIKIIRRVLGGRQGLSLPAILLAALGLRLIALDQSLWLDEAIEWWAVKSFGLRELLTRYMVGDFNPPGHHLLMWFWVRVFGESEIALRMPSVVFGVGTVWFVYLIANLLRSDLGVRQGRTFAHLAAVNGLMIYYSQEARMYAAAAFFVSGAMYFFMKMNKTNKTDKTNGTDYAIYCLFLAAAMYSHYLTWLMLPFVAIWGLRYLAPAALTVVWWPMLWKQFQAGLSAAGNPVWAELSRTNFKNLSLVAVKFVTGRVGWPQSWWGEMGVGLVVLIFWTMAAVGGIRLIRVIRQIRDHELMLIFWAVGPLVLGAAIGLFVPVFTYFRFLFVVPAMLILFSLGASQLGRLGKFVKLGGLGVMLVFSGWYLLTFENQREDWRGAVAELHRQETAPAVIIHSAVRPPFDYYDRGNSIVVVERSDLAAARSDLNKPSVWYIPYAQQIFDPEDSMRKFLEELGYVRVYERHFRGVTLERWDIKIATAPMTIGASQ
jgi:hypothetical protein